MCARNGIVSVDQATSLLIGDAACVPQPTHRHGDKTHKPRRAVRATRRGLVLVILYGTSAQRHAVAEAPRQRPRVLSPPGWFSARRTRWFSELARRFGDNLRQQEWS